MKMVWENGDIKVFECGCTFRFASYSLNDPPLEGWLLQKPPICDHHIEFLEFLESHAA